jgi:hypothetical protein
MTLQTLTIVALILVGAIGFVQTIRLGWARVQLHDAEELARLLSHRLRDQETPWGPLHTPVAPEVRERCACAVPDDPIMPELRGRIIERHL